MRIPRYQICAFWWIIMFNWTAEERLELRAFVESWMAADHSADK